MLDLVLERCVRTYHVHNVTKYAMQDAIVRHISTIELCSYSLLVTK